MTENIKDHPVGQTGDISDDSFKGLSAQLWNSGQIAASDHSSLGLLFDSGVTSIIRNLPDGRRLSIRRTEVGFVWEEFQFGRLTRAVVSGGVRYAQVMDKDLQSSTLPQQVRFTLAKAILEDKIPDGSKCSALEKLHALDAVSQFAGSQDRSIKLKAASYLVRFDSAHLQNTDEAESLTRRFEQMKLQAIWSITELSSEGCIQASEALVDWLEHRIK